MTSPALPRSNKDQSAVENNNTKHDRRSKTLSILMVGSLSIVAWFVNHWYWSLFSLATLLENESKMQAVMLGTKPQLQPQQHAGDSALPTSERQKQFTQRKGSQYTLALRKGNGQIRRVVGPISRVTVVDVKEWTTDETVLSLIGDAIANKNQGKAKGANNNGNKEPILASLRASGIEHVTDVVLGLLPSWEQITDLYGPNIPLTVSGNKQACERYRERVPPKDRYVGVAGMFNTGTTALALYLANNLILPESNIQWDTMKPNKLRNQKALEDHKWEVPWGKHRFLYRKDNFTNDGTESFPKQNAMAVVIVRDPFTWMQSMCKTPYMAKWRHRENHCPNLIADQLLDLPRFPGLYVNEPVPVHIPPQQHGEVSLLHIWQQWYTNYYVQYLLQQQHAFFVRFEDLVFAPDKVVDQIRQCVNGTWKKPEEFVYLVGPAKWHHKQMKERQTNRITAMIQYGTVAQQVRVRNMTAADLKFAKDTLYHTKNDTKNVGMDLMKVFSYQLPP